MTSSGDALAALAQLRAASRALAEATGVESVLDTLMQRTLTTAGAQGVVIVAVRADEGLDVLATTYGDQSHATLDGLRITTRGPLTDAVREGRTVWVADGDEFAATYPDMAPRAQSVAWVTLPLRSGARIIGALGVGFDEAQEFGEVQRLALLTIADLCATALDRHVLEARRSEHRLRTLIDTNVIGVIGGDIAVITEANDAFLEMIGLTTDDLARGIDFRAITAPEFRDADDRAVAGADADGRFGPYDKEYVHSSGHRVAARVVGAIISLDGRGRWIALVEDRTEARRRENELQATSARLEAVMRNAPVGFAFIDADLRFQVVNEKLAEINGIPVEDHLGRAVRDVVPTLSDANEGLFRRALAGERIIEADFSGTARGAPAVRRDWLVSCYPVRDQIGDVLGIGTTVVDVTDRNRLLRAERSARNAAETSAHLSEAFSAIATIIAHVDSDEAIAFGAGTTLSASLRADATLVSRSNSAGRITKVLFAHGYEPEEIALLHNSGDPTAWSTAKAVGTRTAVFYNDPTEFLERFPMRAAIVETLGAHSWAVVPLVAGDEALGFVVVMFRTPHEFTADERRFITTAGDVVAQAMLRARARADEVLAREAAERLADRALRLQQFAAAMARAASVDAVVQAMVTEGAEAAGAHLTRVAMRAAEDPGLEVLQTNQASPAEAIAWMPVDARSDNENISALRSIVPMYYTSRAVYEDQFAGARGEIAADSVAALAALPLLDSNGRVIASISFAFSTPRPFTTEDRGFLETVADIAAQALDRARLYERERDVARALQMALLPAALPELDDVTTEARYIAGGAGVSVGGDWYDVLRFADGRVGLLIGDAAGRGVEAASLMGKARHAAAALAMDRDSPAAVLSRVNEYLHTISSRRDMLTCCYVVLDRDRGTLTYASAGHPPPLIIETGSDPCFLYGGRGVPLGVIPIAAYSDAEYQLRGATTIVLYTDGLIERRGETIDAGLDRLLATVRGHETNTRALCDHLTKTLLADGSDDDVALLAARVHSVASHAGLEIELPADARRLHELRSRVTRWLNDESVAPTTVADVVVALNEAVSNSMLHAYVGPQPRGHVHVSLALDPTAIIATVSDTGVWHARTDGHDGRGLPLMRSLMTEVHIDRTTDGTRVRLVRSVDRVP